MDHLFTTKAGKFTPLVQVGEKAQIRLSSKIRKALSIKEGDYLGVEINVIYRN